MNKQSLAKLSFWQHQWTAFFPFSSILRVAVSEAGDVCHTLNTHVHGISPSESHAHLLSSGPAAQELGRVICSQERRA